MTNLFCKFCQKEYKNALAHRKHEIFCKCINDTRNDNNKINLRQISIRFFFNLITFFLAGLPLIAMYFSEKNLSLSDKLSRTSYKKI